MRKYAGPERRRAALRAGEILVRLKHKFADVIDGVDLSGRHVGERVSLRPRDARLVIAEGWAERIPRERRRRSDFRGKRRQPTTKGPPAGSGRTTVRRARSAIGAH
jgi:hypothetical protein